MKKLILIGFAAMLVACEGKTCYCKIPKYRVVHKTYDSEKDIYYIGLESDRDEFTVISVYPSKFAAGMIEGTYIYMLIN